MKKITKEAFDEFDNAFEDALGELLAAGVTEEDIRAYFGPTALGHYIIERFKAGG